MKSEIRSALPVLAQLPRLRDRQGFATLFAGGLLLLISFTTNDGDDNLLHFASLLAAVQIRICLHVAALVALAGDVELAACLRHRDARTRE